MFWNASVQSSLFKPLGQKDEYVSLWNRFLYFDQAHPEIYEEFILRAKKILRKRKKTGAKRIIENIRWDFDMENDDEYKINNNYIACYVRKFLKEYPEYNGCFELRKMKRG